jgi:predicted metal-dependent hydrolase
MLRVKDILLISDEHDVVAMASEPGLDGQRLIRFRYSVAVIQIFIIVTQRWLAMWLANDGFSVWY